MIIYCIIVLINNMQNEYIDLPINVQQTPKHLLERAEPFKAPPQPQQAANLLLKNLQALIKGSPNDLYLFYQTAMTAVYKEHFTDKQWPAANVLQQQFDTEYKPGAITIYKQFAIRTTWHKTKHQKIADKYWDLIDEIWEEYTSIFEHELNRINFPPEMIWDYYDSFLEIYMFHRTKSPVIPHTRQNCTEYFDTNKVKALFNKISESTPSNFTQNISSKQIFAYYSLAALGIIQVSEGNFKEALGYISRISLKEMSIFSRGMGSLLTTFFVAAFSHFMLDQYYKSVKLCELVVPFYHKYRKFFDKSFSYHTQLQPLYQKLVILQCINYIFLEEKPKTTFMEIFKNTNVKTKEKQARDKISDCFFKMKQNDLTTFWRLFNFLCFQYAIPNIEKTVTQKFKNLQSVNINTIIQNYKRVELSKMAKMLNISSEEVLKKIKSLGAVQKTQSPWDSTIMNPLLKQKKVNVVIEDNVAVFDSQNVDTQQSAREWKRYREEIAWLHEKVKVL